MGGVLEVRLRRRPAARPGPRVEGPEDVREICRDLAEADRERFHVLHLDAGNRLLAREEVAVGTLTATLLTCREVFKGALLQNSAAVILVHNHPSGDPRPSSLDREVTARLVEAGTLLGVPVLDHVVVAREGWRSLGPCGRTGSRETFHGRGKHGTKGPPSPDGVVGELSWKGRCP